MEKTVKNRIREANQYHTVSSNYTVDCYVSWLERGCIDLNPVYQRELVWETENKRMFVENLIAELPVGSICLARVRDEAENRFIEVVDGKQRLSAIFDFMNNEFNVAVGNQMVYWDDLTIAEKRVFENLPLSAVTLHDSTMLERMEYFYRINFAGVPQSEEHRQYVVALIQDEQLKK